LFVDYGVINVSENFDKLITEQINPRSLHIDTCGTKEILEIINDEDKKVPAAVSKVLDNIEAAVDTIVEAIRAGGRLIYIGAGTSGRLGILDAAECPPTFGVDPELIKAVIAGGNDALIRAVEGAEDNAEMGIAAVRENNVSEKDVVVGISASGRTPFVMAAIEEAKRVGARTVGISNNSTSPLKETADIEITPLVGPEVIMGSTRMKAGTSQKLVLNMISTAVMIKLGKVYKNLMIDVKATNKKLVDRQVRIVMKAIGTDEDTAKKYLALSDMDAKAAVTMYKMRTDRKTAKRLLAENDGFVSKAIGEK